MAKVGLVKDKGTGKYRKAKTAKEKAAVRQKLSARRRQHLNCSFRNLRGEQCKAPVSISDPVTGYHFCANHKRLYDADPDMMNTVHVEGFIDKAAADAGRSSEVEYPERYMDNNDMPELEEQLEAVDKVAEKYGETPRRIRMKRPGAGLTKEAGDGSVSPSYKAFHGIDVEYYTPNRQLQHIFFFINPKQLLVVYIHHCTNPANLFM